MASFLVQLQICGLTVLPKMSPSQMFFLWKFWSFTEHHFYRTLLGDYVSFPAAFSTYHLFYQQYFSSVIASCLGLSETAIRKRSIVFTLKVIKVKQSRQWHFVAEVDITNKRIFSRSSHPEVLCKKIALYHLAELTGKKDLFLNKVAGCIPTTLFKQRHMHSCFSVNFLKLFRKVFLVHLWTAVSDLIEPWKIWPSVTFR